MNAEQAEALQVESALWKTLNRVGIDPAILSDPVATKRTCFTDDDGNTVLGIYINLTHAAPNV